MRPGRLDPELTRRAQIAAGMLGLSASDFVRLAVDTYCTHLAAYVPGLAMVYDADLSD